MEVQESYRIKNVEEHDLKSESLRKSNGWIFLGGKVREGNGRSKELQKNRKKHPQGIHGTAQMPETARTNFEPPPRDSLVV